MAAAWPLVISIMMVLQMFFLRLTRVATNYILTKAILNLKIFLTKPVSEKKDNGVQVLSWLISIMMDGWIFMYAMQEAWIIHR